MKLNDKIDEMFLLRERKRGLEGQVKEVNAEIAQCQEDLMRRLDEVGTATARGSMASIVITENVVPNIDDWGAVSEWVVENDAVYLLHRRVSAGPWKELMDAGQNVPGITPYTKRAISLTKLRD
jgi:hypothetical protein